MKNSIKYIFLLITSLSFSQVVVSDVTANTTLQSQLATSTQQLTQLEKSYKLLKDAEEKYQKVNSIITSVFQIGEIVELQKEAINNVSLVMKYTRYKGESREKLMKILNNTLLAISMRLETVSTVLQGGFFSMTDKERIDMFQKERSSIFALVSKTRGYANPYRNR